MVFRAYRYASSVHCTGNRSYVTNDNTHNERCEHHAHHSHIHLKHTIHIIWRQSERKLVICFGHSQRGFILHTTPNVSHFILHAKQKLKGIRNNITTIELNVCLSISIPIPYNLSILHFYMLTRKIPSPCRSFIPLFFSSQFFPLLHCSVTIFHHPCIKNSIWFFCALFISLAPDLAVRYEMSSTSTK